MNEQNKNHAEQLDTLLNDLDGGTFSGVCDRALRDVALGVAVTGKVGKVTIEFNLKRIGESNQVACTSVIKYQKPTSKGKATEDFASITPLHVGYGGKLSLFPENQTKLPLEHENR